MPETVLLTGASGFIAKHVMTAVLAAGHSMRATLRDPAKGDALRALVPLAGDRLSLAKADLLRDDGWGAAMDGVTALIHTASPFPIAQPRNPDDLIRPAVDGTVRVLRAARTAGVGRVILTSSAVAILRTDRSDMQDEADWADLTLPGTTAYAKSKTLAERAAWDFVAEAPQMALTTINPGLVLGPLLDDTFGSSVSVVKRFLSGRDPAIPALSLPVVDVRDVALMHLRALERPATGGKRFIASAGSMWFMEMAKTLKAAYPDRQIAMRAAPAWLLRLFAPFDAEIRAILPGLGRETRLSNARARSELGMEFVPAPEAVLATAHALIARHLA